MDQRCCLKLLLPSRMKRRSTPPENSTVTPPNPVQELQTLIHVASFLRPANCLPLPQPDIGPPSAETEVLDALANLGALTDESMVSIAVKHHLVFGIPKATLTVACSDPDGKVVAFLSTFLGNMRSVMQGEAQPALYEMRINALQHTWPRLMSRLKPQYGDFLTVYGIIQSKISNSSDDLLRALRSVVVFGKRWRNAELLAETFWADTAKVRELWLSIYSMNIRVQQVLPAVRDGSYYGVYADTHRFDLGNYLIRLLDIPNDIVNLCHKACGPFAVLSKLLTSPCYFTSVELESNSFYQPERRDAHQWSEVISNALNDSVYSTTKGMVHKTIEDDCKRIYKKSPREIQVVNAECRLIEHLLGDFLESPSGRSYDYVALSKRPSDITLFWIHTFNTCIDLLTDQETEPTIPYSFSCTFFRPEAGCIGGSDGTLWVVPASTVTAGPLQQNIIAMMYQGICDSFAKTYPGFLDKEVTADSLQAARIQTILGLWEPGV